jgi:hypothetical protein
MLLEMTLILLGISVVGFGLAGYWDLRTTEFPDWLPYAMIALALGTRGAFSLFTGDFSLITGSVLFGTGFLAFGLALYWMRQWGDGDAWLLGATGFLWPDSGSIVVPTLFPFSAAILFNFFFIAFFYLLVYSVGLGVRSPDVSKKFLKELRDARMEIARLVGIFTLACIALIAVISWQYSIPLAGLIYIMGFPLLLLSVIVFTRYGRFVESNLFRKKISAREIRVGDVLIEDRWRGLTEQEARKIRRKGGEVWIKEGVRFAPVFLINVLVTLMWGSILVLFL